MKRVMFFSVISIFLLSNVSCTGGFQALSGAISGLSSRVENQPLPQEEPLILPIPDTDKIDSACKANTNFDACIFLGDPVNQTQAILSPSDLNSDLEKRQSFGIKIRSLSPNSDQLKNSWLTIENNNNPHLNPNEVSTNLTDLNKVSQVMAYYWVNQTVEYWKALSAVNYFSDAPLTVVIDDKLFGLSKNKNTIHMQKQGNGVPSSLDAGVMIHLVGQALVNSATRNAVKKESLSRNHRNCSVSGLCCTEEKGCAQSVKLGISDFLVYSMFGQSYKIGAGFKNSINGSATCGVSRSVPELKDLTASEAFSACQNENSQGAAVVLGSLYASIWWETRKVVSSVRGEKQRESFDKLFFTHISLIDANDDFITLLEKVKSLDERQFDSKWYSYLKNEYTRRGLSTTL